MKESNISLDITSAIKPDTYWEVRTAIDVNDFNPSVFEFQSDEETQFLNAIPIGFYD